MSVQISISSLSNKQKNLIFDLLFFQPKAEFFNASPFNSQPKDPIRFYISNTFHDVIFLPFAFANILLESIPNANLSYPHASFSFTSKLRDDQMIIANEALEKLNKNGAVILGCHPGFGKCLAQNTSVLLFNGTSKLVQDIKVGDRLRGPDCRPRTVATLGSGTGPLFEICPESGDPFTVNDAHILTLLNLKTGQLEDIELSIYLHTCPQHSQSEIYHVVWYPSEYDAQNLDYDPFEFGAHIKSGPIPPELKVNSYDVRRSFLLGWLSQTEPLTCLQLAQDLANLARSIGWVVRRHLLVLDIRPAANAEEVGQYQHEPFIVRAVGHGSYYGFTLDLDGRFLLTSQMLTHNTVVTAYLGSKLDGVVLVLYHRTILQDQWLATMKNFTNAGVWVHGRDPPEQFNVILTMDTTITKLPIEVLNMVKCLVIDEAHAFCVPSRLNALLVTQPRYIIACSATLDTRTDGMQDMMYALCGQNVVNKKACKQFIVYKMMTNISPQLKYMVTGRLDWNLLQKDLAENEHRNKNIVDLVQENCEHKIIILTKLCQHVDFLFREIAKLGISVDTLSGNKKSYNDSQVLVGTFSKIGTGFDEATACANFGGRKANLLIICSSIKNLGNLEQYVGRVFRVDSPIIFHLVDDVPTIKSHWYGCQKWYQQHGAKVYDVDLNLNFKDDSTVQEILTRPTITQAAVIKPKNDLLSRIKARDTDP